jgi:hypothetical protein
MLRVRQSTGEELERLVPPRLLSLEQALEFCADDECVEVTSPAVRLRKTILGASERNSQRSKAAKARGEREKQPVAPAAFPAREGPAQRRDRLQPSPR